jgi:hypothetical protein
MADRARVRAHLTIAIVLLSAIVATAVACGGVSQSREVSFPTADGCTVVADLNAARGSDALVLAHGPTELAASSAMWGPRWAPASRSWSTSWSK